MSPHPSYKFHALPSSDESEHDLQPYAQKRDGRFLLYYVILALSVGVNVIFAVSLVRCQRYGCSLYPQLTTTPAQNSIAYKITTFGGVGSSLIYEQDPSQTVDVAWRDLYDFSGSTLPGYNRAPSFNETLEFMKQRGSKIRLLDVFHQLHCLDTIRRAFYPQYYTPPTHPDHVIHCINSIRQSLVCMSDVSDVSWVWDNNIGALVESKENKHTCRDFEKIKQWALENHYDRQFIRTPLQ